MPWIAKRRAKLRGVDYQPGDEVPGDQLRNRRVLEAQGYIVEVPEPKPEPTPTTTTTAAPATTTTTTAPARRGTVATRADADKE